MARSANLLSSLLLACSLNADAREFEYIDIDEDIRERIKERLSTRVEERISSNVRARAKTSIENRVSDTIENNISDRISSHINAKSTRPDEVRSEITQPKRVKAKIREASILEDEPLEIDRLFDIQLDRVHANIHAKLSTVEDDAGNAALADEWLIMTDELSLAALKEQGYLVKDVEKLSGLGYVLGTVQAPRSFSPKALSSAVQIVDDPQIVVDLNHVYLPQNPPRRTATKIKATSDTKIRSKPRSSSEGLAQINTGIGGKIGMIDSGIDTSHPVFRNSVINEQTFTPKKGVRSINHGTAIASLLVGQSADFTGHSPDSHLFNGVVFATDDQGREFSTTSSIVRAINWLAINNVKLINMSLAGPDNAVLRQAITAACNQNILIITAAGNAGPAAKPLYPAAYECTLAVTAVGDRGITYHRANRGDHIDYALPGVNVYHASDSNTFRQSSGTSFASAQLTGLIASQWPQSKMTIAEIRARLNRIAVDLGQAGRDPIYGEGLISPMSTTAKLLQ